MSKSKKIKKLKRKVSGLKSKILILESTVQDLKEKEAYLENEAQERKYHEIDEFNASDLMWKLNAAL